jgi:hypothetical protein
MSKQEALFQSLATAGAVLVTFIGVVHEFIGAKLFPWGPALLGGPIVWHGLGVGSTMVGLLMTAGVLRIIKFPVITCSVIIAVAGLSVMLLTAVLYQEFHLFALTVCLAAITTGGCYRRAGKLARYE